MLGFPGGEICLQGTCGRPGVHPWVGKICRRERLPTPVSLPEEFHRQRSLADYSPLGCKESDTAKRLSHHQESALVFSPFSAKPLESCRVCETSTVGPPPDRLSSSEGKDSPPERPPPPPPRGPPWGLPCETATWQSLPCILCYDHTHLVTGHAREDRRCYRPRFTVVINETREAKTLALGSHS